MTPNLTIKEKSIVCCNSLKFSEQKFIRIFWGENLKGKISNFVNYGPLGYISSCCQYFLLDLLNFFKSSPQFTVDRHKLWNIDVSWEAELFRRDECKTFAAIFCPHVKPIHVIMFMIFSTSWFAFLPWGKEKSQWHIVLC